jgi:hypothetical protein
MTFSQGLQSGSAEILERMVDIPDEEAEER